MDIQEIMDRFEVNDVDFFPLSGLYPRFFLIAVKSFWETQIQ